MDNFSNNRSVKFVELRGSGIYSQELIDELQNGNYEVLARTVESNQRRDISFMEPILYAVKNEYGTYKVYKYYGENLQNNIELARDIIKSEPELIEDTPVSNNLEFVLESAKINPKVVQYMSPTLKSNSDFAEQLCELQDKEVIGYVVKECKMPDLIKENLLLAGNIEFMKEVVKQDVGLLKYATDNLKNDYEFIKQISNNNKEVIDYVSEHTEEFGQEGLTATKDSLVEMSTEEAISGFKEEEEKIGKKLDEKDDNETEELTRRQKQLQRHIRLFERIKSGEIDPVRAAKLMDKLCKNLDEEYKKEIEQLLKIDKAILDRHKENQEKEGTPEESQGITNTDVEKIVKGVELVGYRQEVSVTIDEVKSMENTSQEAISTLEN